LIEYEKEYQVRWRSGQKGKAGIGKAESRNALPAEPVFSARFVYLYDKLAQVPFNE
jgi:hypothetical protein